MRLVRLNQVIGGPIYINPDAVLALQETIPRSSVEAPATTVILKGSVHNVFFVDGDIGDVAGQINVALRDEQTQITDIGFGITCA